MEIILSNILLNVHPIVTEINIITKLIFYFSFISWLLPPFRQHKGGYFFYFLILALAEPLGFALYLLFRINPQYSYAPSSLALLLVSLYYFKYLKSSVVFINILVLFIIAVLTINTHNIIVLLTLTAFYHLEIFSGYTICLIRKLVYRNIFYTYFLIIIFYEFSLILKFVGFFFDLKTGLGFSYLLTALEVIICFYFIFYNIKTSPRFHTKIEN